MELELVTREKSETSKWIVERSSYFLSLRDDGVELWKSNRPYGANDRIDKFPAGYMPTLKDIDCAIYYDGDYPDQADMMEAGWL